MWLRDRVEGGLTEARSSFSESALFLMDGEDSGSGGGLQSHTTHTGGEHGGGGRKAFNTLNT